MIVRWPWVIEMGLAQVHNTLFQPVACQPSVVETIRAEKNVPFEKSSRALREFATRLVLRVDDRRHLVVGQVVGDGVFEVGWEITKRKVGALVCQ